MNARVPLALLLALLGSAWLGCSAVDTAALSYDAAGVPASADGSAVGTDGGIVHIDAANMTCPLGQLVCAAACIDPSLDPANCGGCGLPCAAGATCVSGTCTCTPGTATCGSVVGSPDRCGAASVTCATSELCLGSVCTCRPGLTRVGATCVDLSSDPLNCGSPGTHCTTGVCSAGTCATSCAAATTRCGAACVNTDTSPLDCGECGGSCNRNEVCVSGRCRRYTPAGDCAMCPCPTACSGDGSTCCTYPGTSAPICVSAGSC